MYTDRERTVSISSIGEALQSIAARPAVDAEFDESKHPRGGDPENKGRFSKSGGGGGGSSESGGCGKGGIFGSLSKVLRGLSGKLKGSGGTGGGETVKRDTGEDISHPVERHMVRDGNYSREEARAVISLYEGLNGSSFGKFVKKGYHPSQLIEDLKDFAKSRGIKIERFDDFSMAHGKAEILNSDMHSPKVFELIGEGVSLVDLAKGNIPRSVPNYPIGRSKRTTHDGIKEAARRYTEHPDEYVADRRAYQLRKAAVMMYMLNSGNPLVDPERMTMVVGRTETPRVVPDGTKEGDAFTYNSDPFNSYTYDYFKVIDGSANNKSSRKVALGYEVPLCKVSNIDFFPNMAGDNSMLGEFTDLMGLSGEDPSEYEVNVNTRGCKAVLLGDAEEFEKRGRRISEFAGLVRERSRA